MGPNRIGKTRQVEDEVYQPSEDTFLLLDAIDLLGDRVFERSIDVGTGGGALAQALCRISTEVYAVDISRKATEEAWRRLKSSRCRASTHVIHGDLLSMFRRAPIFDLVVSNPPYLPPEGLGDAAVEGGVEFIKRLIDAVPEMLKDGGTFLLLVSSLTSDLEDILSFLRARGMTPYIRLSRKIFFEELVVIESVKERR